MTVGTAQFKYFVTCVGKTLLSQLISLFKSQPLGPTLEPAPHLHLKASSLMVLRYCQAQGDLTWLQWI